MEKVKNSIGNGEAKELIHTTHRYELRVGENAGERGSARWGVIKGRKSGTTLIA